MTSDSFLLYRYLNLFCIERKRISKCTERIISSCQIMEQIERNYTRCRIIGTCNLRSIIIIDVIISITCYIYVTIARIAPCRLERHNNSTIILNGHL